MTFSKTRTIPYHTIPCAVVCCVIRFDARFPADQLLVVVSEKLWEDEDYSAIDKFLNLEPSLEDALGEKIKNREEAGRWSNNIEHKRERVNMTDDARVRVTVASTTVCLFVCVYVVCGSKQ